MKAAHGAALLISAVFLGTAPDGAGQTAASAEPEAAATPQGPADLRVPDLDRSFITPDSRDYTAIKEDEINPFGMVTMMLDQMVKTETVTEEKRLRQILTGMRVSGIGGSEESMSAQVGSVLVRQGDLLPRLFAGQAEKLRVRSISDRGVVLEFIERNNNKEPRTIGLPVDLRPRVDSFLAGEAFLKVIPLDADGAVLLPPLELDAAKAALQAAEQQDFRSLVERRTELLNAPAVPKSDEKTAP